MNTSNDQPLVVYGTKVSYFTGKLENYLRYKEIPYEHIPMSTLKIQSEIRKNLGVIQVPNVKLPDGSWMTDTTPMIQWFEEKYPDGPIIPSDPEQVFFCLLLEDYADEWLWRPAMHYRWHYQRDALSLSRFLSEDVFAALPFPKWIRRFIVRFRQRHIFTVGDGIHERKIQGLD
ncbi:glutathione S-transferase N-terminal domain-containing protein, partial [bacterium]|nr:glutathione S-transferase N-terminal domain-containing protein [bacterium]